MPDKYNEILRILFAKEIRVYLPIEELNLLLEPLPKPGDFEANEASDEAHTDDEVKSPIDADDSSSNSRTPTSDDDDDDNESLISAQNSDNESHSTCEESFLD